MVSARAVALDMPAASAAPPLSGLLRMMQVQGIDGRVIRLEEFVDNRRGPFSLSWPSRFDHLMRPERIVKNSKSFAKLLGSPACARRTAVVGTRSRLSSAMRVS